jgi:hypothetical protein
MRTRRIAIGAAAAAAIAGGAAVAVANNVGGKDPETQILSDAAKRLNVTPSELRQALSAAQDDQLDAAVKAGQLTQQQADDIRAHRKADGHVLGFGRGPGGPGFDGHHGGPMDMDAVAKALGLSQDELFTKLRSGKTLAEIAKAQGKSLDDVKAAVKKAVLAQLDADLKAGRITKAQRDEEAAEIDEHLAHFGERPPGFDGDHDHVGPPGFGHP